MSNELAKMKIVASSDQNVCFLFKLTTEKDPSQKSARTHIESRFHNKKFGEFFRSDVEGWLAFTIKQ